MARRKHYNYYDDDFKATAVALTEIPGILSKDVAEGLDIHPFMLSRWRKEYREGKLHGDGQRRIGVNKKKKAERHEPLLKAWHRALKADGIVGIADHRQDPDGTDARTGYIKEQAVIEIMDRHGFKLLKRSEINANPQASGPCLPVCDWASRTGRNTWPSGKATG